MISGHTFSGQDELCAVSIVSEGIFGHASQLLRMILINLEYDFGHTSTLVMSLVSFQAQQDLDMREEDDGNKPLIHHSSHDFCSHFTAEMIFLLCPSSGYFG
jgi:hypothetical protein